MSAIGDAVKTIANSYGLLASTAMIGSFIRAARSPENTFWAKFWQFATGVALAVCAGPFAGKWLAIKAGVDLATTLAAVGFTFGYLAENILSFIMQRVSKGGKKDGG